MRNPAAGPRRFLEADTVQEALVAPACISSMNDAVRTMENARYGSRDCALSDFQTNVCEVSPTKGKHDFAEVPTRFDVAPF